MPHVLAFATATLRVSELQSGMTVRGSIAEWREFFGRVAKPPSRFRVDRSAPFMTADGWKADGLHLRHEAQQEGLQNFSASHHRSSTYWCHEPGPSRIMMLNDLGCRQMLAVCGCVAVCGNHGFKT